MAFQINERDPLLDSRMAQQIERRGQELLGLIMIGLGLLAFAICWSYTPNDPNWLVSTDAPVENWLGETGAALAALFFMIIGLSTWSIPVMLLFWGARFVMHRETERAFLCLILSPVVFICGAIFAAILEPGTQWQQTHSFGMGGLLGDTLMGAVLTALLIQSAVAINLMSAVMALGMLGLASFALGFTRAELSELGRFLLLGLIVSYAGVIVALGYTARGAVRVSRGMRGRMGRNLVRSATKKPGFFARIPVRITRAAITPDAQTAVQNIEMDNAGGNEDTPDSSDERVRARIAEVIKSRFRASPGQRPGALLSLTRGRRPEPLVLATDPQPTIDKPGSTNLHSNRTEPALSAPTIQADAISRLISAPPLQVPKSATRTVHVEPANRKPVQPSTRAKAEAQPTLAFEDTSTDFELPPLNLLEKPQDTKRYHLSDEALAENARMLETVLDDYGVRGEIVSVRPGPVVTMYELEPAPGLKASRVIGLADDIARSMAALSARVSTLPGRSVIGIELPNEHREKVVLREILASRDFGDGNQRLPLALGKDISGDPVVANLAKMPHLLIAGTTGSGKSVAINTMILSLLYKLTPRECRLIMIDPKMLELSVYDGIPHLLSPVVTDPKKAVVALKWVVGEMEERYRKMSKISVRNIEGYNSRVRDALSKGEMFSRTVQTGFDDETGEPVFETEQIEPVELPFIVVVVDEMADLMMVAGKEIEACIQRLAQMARASGIHLIMATQRPSVDVITGTIKANFPTRISFQVTSKIDSRTILGEMGAEQLLGMGDMLYMAGGAKISRCHGPFVSDEEVEEIVRHLKSFGPPDYVGGVVQGPDENKSESIDAVLGLGGNTSADDSLYDQAVAIVLNDRKCSTSYIQRKLAIGYNKAARLVEQMEDQGVVSPSNHVGKREVLVPEPA